MRLAHTISKRWICSACLLILLLLLLVDPALAQDADPATSTNDLGKLISVLIFGLLGMGALLWYTKSIQDRFYDTTEKLAQRGGGVTVSAESIPEIAMLLQSDTDRSTAATIKGNTTTQVGIKSTAYTLSHKDGEIKEPVTWTVSPPESAVVLPTTASTAHVVPAKSGAFQLHATTADNKKAAPLQIAALTTQPSQFKLPFVGAGFGSLYVSIMILTAAVALGLLDILQGESISTLLGALAGYIFGFSRGKEDPPTEQQNG